MQGTCWQVDYVLKALLVKLYCICFSCLDVSTYFKYVQTALTLTCGQFCHLPAASDKLKRLFSHRWPPLNSVHFCCTVVGGGVFSVLEATHWVWKWPQTYLQKDASDCSNILSGLKWPFFPNFSFLRNLDPSKVLVYLWLWCALIDFSDRPFSSPAGNVLWGLLWL